MKDEKEVKTSTCIHNTCTTEEGMHLTRKTIRSKKTQTVNACKKKQEYLLRWLWNFTLKSVCAEYVILRAHGPTCSGRRYLKQGQKNSVNHNAGTVDNRKDI